VITPVAQNYAMMMMSHQLEIIAEFIHAVII
jgi:hypothetical protein